MSTSQTPAQPTYLEELGKSLDRREVTLQTEQKDNAIFVVGGKLGLEAIENKILVLVDKFKSGYECKDCNETGLYVACECARAGRFGEKDNGKSCFYKDRCSTQVVGEKCKTCNGTGHTIAIPETSKMIPTSGLIVSTGPQCVRRSYGERVVFGAHTGYNLPFKGNSVIRCMREDEPLALLYLVDKETSLSDFIQIDEPIDNRE